MLRVEMLPAGHGDSLLVEYGPDADGPMRRILVDGGPWYAYDEVLDRLKQIPDNERDFELLIVTHVDSDHVDGIIRLLQEPDRPFRFRDVWFNGRKHLEKAARGELAGHQGEYLGALLDRDGWSWNGAFDGDPVTAGTAGAPPSRTLGGGLEMTILSPTAAELSALLPVWDEAVRDAGFEPGNREQALEQLERRARYRPLADLGAGEEDNSAANGSSIAVLARHGESSVLLAGDAWPRVLERSLDRLPRGERTARALKLSHHGGYANITRGVVERVRPEQYLVSTNGAYYKHPHAYTIELILQRHVEGSPHFAFNYASDETSPWLDSDTQARRGFTADLVTGRPVEV